MKRIIAATFAAMVLLGSGTAQALPITYNLGDNLRTLGPLEKELIDLALGGTLTLDDGDFGNFGPGKTGFTPVTDFDLELTYEIDLGNGLTPVTIPINNTTSSIVLNNQTTRITKDAIMIDASGVPLGTPLFDIQVDRFVDANGQPTEFGFPNGRRVGDDPTDLLILQMFRGSINLGFAALDNGIPALIETRQLSPGDTFTLATAANPAVVPLPGGLVLLLSGLGVLGLSVRKGIA